MNKYHGGKASFTLPILAALLFLAGCGVVAGETQDVNRTFGCYVPANRDTYAKISEEAAALMLAGAVWSVDDGLVLLDSSLDFRLGPITWREGNTYYTAGGVWIQARAKVEVAEGAEKGEKHIKVQLPSVPTVAQALGGTAACASGHAGPDPFTAFPKEYKPEVALNEEAPPTAYTGAEPLTVSTLRVYGSAAGRNLACIGTILLVLGGVVGYVALVRRR